MGARTACSWLAAVALGLAGCASLDGARSYRSGSDALERGDVAAAIVELEEAARLLPGASEVRNHLGIAYLEAGRRDDARRAFEEAVSLDCTNAAARHNLGVLRETAGVERGPEPETAPGIGRGTHP